MPDLRERHQTKRKSRDQQERSPAACMLSSPFSSLLIPYATRTLDGTKLPSTHRDGLPQNFCHQVGTVLVLADPAEPPPQRCPGENSSGDAVVTCQESMVARHDAAFAVGRLPARQINNMVQQRLTHQRTFLRGLSLPTRPGCPYPSRTPCTTRSVL